MSESEYVMEKNWMPFIWKVRPGGRGGEGAQGGGCEGRGAAWRAVAAHETQEHGGSKLHSVSSYRAHHVAPHAM